MIITKNNYLVSLFNQAFSTYNKEEKIDPDNYRKLENFSAIFDRKLTFTRIFRKYCAKSLNSHFPFLSYFCHFWRNSTYTLTILPDLV